jgi:UDP-glucose:(heptosyl)LPS alpha-1,3-glucosyltransferase
VAALNTSQTRLAQAPLSCPRRSPLEGTVVKIGLVRSDLSGNGGAERYSLAVLERLAAQGWETHVFTSRLPQAPNPTVLFIPHLQRGKKTPRFFRHIAFQKWLAREVPKHNLDFLLTLERMIPSDIYRAGGGVHRVWRDLQLQQLPAPSRTLARLDPSHAQTLRAEKAIFNPDNTRLVICNSQMVADEVAQHYSFPRERLRVVPNGVDLEKFSIGDNHAARAQYGFAPDEFVVLFAGSGFWRKGADVALRIIAAWQKTTKLKLRAVFVGRAENDSFTKLAHELGLNSTVLFAGAQPAAAMPDWYRAADMFLFPTRYDPFANACLEAAVCGAAVATSDKNGFASHLAAQTGLVLPESFEEAAQKLEAFCAAKPSREAVRAGVAHLSLDSHIEKLLAVFDEAGTFPRPRGLS